jgi:glycerol-3-phosphate dehydrogenase
MEKVYDLAIIGGGINGCGIARDAAGRGYSVYLCEQNDLASGTSSWSTKLIHGGLRYLEYFKFRLVRESLVEREVLWKLAPHIIRPLRFVLPHHAGLRPAWLLRLGLFLYDHIGGRKLLPATRGLDLASDPAGAPLKRSFVRAFEYSDCWVEDSRLVLLNAMAARAHGATIETKTQMVSAERENEVWRIKLQQAGQTYTILARALINAAGPWVAEVLERRVQAGSTAKVRLVQGSHIVVCRLFDHDRCYIFQNSDGRVLFAIPYEQDFTLIGTTDQDYPGDPGRVKISDAEIDYLVAAAGEYFARPISRADLVWSYSGVRPLYDDGASKAQEATRDYVLKLDAGAGKPAILSVFGGKITTYRRLAEAVLDKISQHLDAPSGERKAARGKGWTAREVLPGGDFPVEGFEVLVAELCADHPALPEPLLRRLARAYGTCARSILREMHSTDDLGEDFGAGLSAREVDYLMAEEWARNAADVLWRRSKLGLRLSSEQVEALDRHMASRLQMATMAERQNEAGAA